MSAVRTEMVPALDGRGTFAGTVTIPARGSGPGLLLLHEVLGVNDYVLDLGRRLAGLGYVTLAPDLFWRQVPGVNLGRSDEDLAQGVALGKAFDWQRGREDLTAALAALRALPEVRGGAGVIGFCFGGSMAYLAAATADPDVAVSYYGSAIPDLLDLADQIRCPILLHFGEDDVYLPNERAELVAEMFAHHEAAVIRMYGGAGHAFDNWTDPRFSQPEPAGEAWAATGEFLARHLPVRR